MNFHEILSIRVIPYLIKWEDDFVSFITQIRSGDGVRTGECLSSIVRTQQTCTELASVSCRLVDFLGHSCKSLKQITNSSFSKCPRILVSKRKIVISLLWWLDSINIESYQANNWMTAPVYLGSHHRFRQGFHRESLFYRALNRLKAILKEGNSNPYSINYRYQEALVCL